MLEKSGAAGRRRIEDWDGPGTAFVINDAIAYLDSLTLFFWQAPGADLLGVLRKSYQRRLIVKAYQVPGRSFAGRRRGGHSKRWHVTIHQPEPETLASLSTIHRRFVVHAVHVAIDFLCPDAAQADLATAYLRRGVVQKWRRRNQNQLSHVEANTMYWSWNGKARRNFAHYGDRSSKAGLGACSHFEMRFTGAAACRRARLGDLGSLIRGVNAMALLKHQAMIGLIDEKRLDRALENLARKKLRKTQRRRPAITVGEIKRDLQRLLPHCIADGGNALSVETITKARAQALWDCRPGLRSCLRRVEWTAFTPEPRWQWLRRSSDQAGAGGTFGTNGNPHLLPRNLLVPVNNKSHISAEPPAQFLPEQQQASPSQHGDPTPRQPDEPNGDNRDGDATNLTDDCLTNMR
jgi:hypothetical protein